MKKIIIMTQAEENNTDSNMKDKISLEIKEDKLK